MRTISPRAFTLIEMLIVIAIMSILSASTVALFTGPLREQARADVLMELQAGLSNAVEVITADAHRASELTMDGDYTRFVLNVGDHDAVYTRDADNNLRRFLWLKGESPLPTVESRPGSVLIPLVENWSVTENSDSVAVSIRAGETRWERPIYTEAQWIATLGLSTGEVEP